MRGHFCYHEHFIPLCLLDGSQVDLDIHLVAYQDTTGLKCLVPVQTEILTVDRCLRAQSSTLQTVHVFELTAILSGKSHLSGNATDRQVAKYTVFAVAKWLNFLAFEDKPRIVFRIEEI